MAGKKQRLEDSQMLIKVLNTPPNVMPSPSPTGLRSLLPKNINELAKSPQGKSIIPVPSPGTKLSQKMIVLQSPGNKIPSQDALSVVAGSATSHNNISLASGNLLNVPLSLKQTNGTESVVQGRAPVLNKLLTGTPKAILMECERDCEKENSSDSLPPSLSYPVTPPKTPEDQRSEDSSSSSVCIYSNLCFLLIQYQYPYRSH